MTASNPARPLIVFAPGAGAGSSSPWMRGWRDRLATVGDVAPLDYPYRLAGRRAPDKLPVLIAAHRAAIAAARGQHPRAPALVLAGKSMGGRVGCHVAAEDAAAGARPAGTGAGIAALVCFGYPLRGTGGGLRDEVLLALRIPVLFVQGTRDPLCPLDLLADVRARMTAPNELMIVDGGNHSLEVPRRPARGAVTQSTAKATTPSTSMPTATATAPAPATPASAASPQAASDDAVLRAVAAFLRGLEINAS